MDAIFRRTGRLRCLPPLGVPLVQAVCPWQTVRTMPIWRHRIRAVQAIEFRRVSQDRSGNQGRLGGARPRQLLGSRFIQIERKWVVVLEHLV